MKKKKQSSTITVAFIAVQLFLVFFYIHHKSSLIKQSFQRQKHDNKKLELAHKKQDFLHALHASKNLSHIKDFALQAQMQKITLDQIKTAPDEHPTA